MLLPRNDTLVYIVFLFLPMLLNYYLYTYQRPRLLWAPLVSLAAELVFITFFIGGFPRFDAAGLIWWMVLIPFSQLICAGSLCALLLSPVWGRGGAFIALVGVLSVSIFLVLLTGWFFLLWLLPLAGYCWAWRQWRGERA